ncbi:STAS domain-containing protein [Streptomyces tropicalis]|uniref:STAS domain-containing protein n=1 Tax=Streptomyces tropicalis TaxID=3034234 RepID=A0ABT6A9A7_9ACTN|nr:STAS domain-containing protein [Streptomyces tropicalis]MDF3301238.1 STAS domain-containing protein [Streptomyces tropicalis]
MPDEREPAVSSSVHGDAFVVQVGGDVDSESAPRLARALKAGLRAGTARSVVDLSGTTFADSAILHALLEAQRAHRARGLLMVVAGPFGDSVERLFGVTGTAGYFVLAEDVEAAMEVPRAVTDR